MALRVTVTRIKETTALSSKAHLIKPAKEEPKIK